MGTHAEVMVFIFSFVLYLPLPFTKNVFLTPNYVFLELPLIGEYAKYLIRY
jgi:hypothetical protein